MAGRRANTDDPTTLEAYSGMTWSQAARKLSGTVHMLAFGREDGAESVAKTFASYGAEPAVAELAACLALRKNGMRSFTAMATGIYSDMAKELAQRNDLTVAGRKMVERLRWAVNSMEDWTAWAACYKTPGFKFEWPVRMPEEMWADLDKRAGLANIMLWLAAEALEDESVCGLVASQGIVRFLKEGLEAKEKRKRCRKGWGVRRVGESAKEGEKR